MKANAKLVGEVTASQTALATGEVDILVGGGEWVTAGLAKENPALDFSIPKEGGILWSQSLAMFAASKNKDLALKFIQYVLCPEGQARLATSSCYWGMPANSKAALTDEQKKILRFDEQPDFLTRAQPYPAPRRRARQEDAGCLDRDAAGAIDAPDRSTGRARSALSPGCSSARRSPWTALFFILPFAAMGVVSLLDHAQGGWHRLRAITASSSPIRATSRRWSIRSRSRAMVTVVSLVLAYPFAWILAEIVPERWQRLALMLAVLPFWTSYIVRSYSWLLVLAERGVLNRAITAMGLVDEPLRLANTRFATVLGFTHFFVMLLTLTIFANLKQLNPNYRRAAADLGAGPVATFILVILPLTAPGIVVGSFLTFVIAMGDYITPQILGGNNELLMPQLIMMQIGRRGDFPLASALSLILMGVVTAGYLLSARWLKLERA